MFRLLVVTNVFYPDCAGGGALFSDLCYALAKKDIDVIVQCAYPYYPEWKNKTNQNKLRILRYKDRGVTVERYGLYIPNCPNSLLQRLLYETSFLFSLLRSLLVKQQKFDVIMVFCPLIGAVAYALFRKLITGVPVWLNVQDLSAEAAEAAGISNLVTINRLFKWIQNCFFNYTDVCSTISPVLIERLKKIKKRKQTVYYLPNWVHSSLVEHIDSFPSKIGRSVSLRPNLLYSGNIGKKQDLIRFCDFLNESDARFKLRIHGNGSEASKIKQWIFKKEDKRFRYRPFLNYPEYVKALNEADLLVITEKEGSGGSFFPSKMLPGIKSGTPILAICDPDTPLGYEMHQFNAGPVFSWAELPQLVNLLNNLHYNTAHYQKWQKNAIERSAFFDRDQIIDRFENILRDIVNKK